MGVQGLNIKISKHPSSELLKKKVISISKNLIILYFI